MSLTALWLPYQYASDFWKSDLPHFNILLVCSYSWKCPVPSNLNAMLHHHHNLFQIPICIWIVCTPLNLISRPTSSLSIHYILAGKVDLIKMSKYRGARDWSSAQDLEMTQISRRSKEAICFMFGITYSVYLTFACFRRDNLPLFQDQLQFFQGSGALFTDQVPISTICS